MRFLLLWLLVSACSPKHLDGYINSEFAVFVQEYAKDSGIYYNYVERDLKSLDINWGELPTNTLAMCSMTFGGRNILSRRILVNYYEWQNKDYLYKEQVIYHELTHCIFMGRHIDVYKNGIPVSIMNTYHIPESIYGPNRDYYVKKLFSEDIYMIMSL